MPHIIVEYSANLDEDADLDGLLDKLHEAAVGCGMFPLGGLRVRAARRDRYRIADLDAANAFCHVTLRVGHGRPLDARKIVCAGLFDVLCEHMQSVYDTRPLSLSLEMQEIDPELSFKKNNIHERLRASGSV